MKAFVCTSCTADGGFLDVVRAGLPDVEVEGIDCMSGCTRAQTIAFRAPRKVAYLFGEITEADMDDLRRFVTLYAASSDGKILSRRSRTIFFS